MGQLLYGSPPESFDVDDRTLAHLEIVVLAKLRRHEALSLALPAPTGGRTTVWLSPASTLLFRYDAGGHDINRAWLEELMDAANTAAGLRIVPEPESSGT